MFYYYFALKLITSLEQITKDVLLEFLNGNEIELKSTHKKLCIPIINRLYIKMLNGEKFSCIKVVDGLIIDGHHRYLASLFAKVNLDRAPSILSSAKTITDWYSVDFDDNDWEARAEIHILDKPDVTYNTKINENIGELPE